MIIDRMELADIVKPDQMAAAVLAQVRAQHGGRLPIPVPVEDIAYAAEIASIDTIDTPNIQGALIISNDEGFILTNASSTPQRRRFTIGHELGHWLLPWHTAKSKTLHCSPAQMKLDFTKGLNAAARIEVEANRFAAELLLPGKELKTDIAPRGEPTLQTVVELSRKYDVSKLALSKRFVALNDYPCAIITSRDLLIEYIFKGGDFPALALRDGNPIPPRSHTFGWKKSNPPCSDLLPAKWENWLRTQPPTSAELFEQVLLQADGFMMTLLYLDIGSSPDEDEEFAENASVWDPRFRR